MTGCHPVAEKQSALSCKLPDVLDFQTLVQKGFHTLTRCCKVREHFNETDWSCCGMDNLFFFFFAGQELHVQIITTVSPIIITVLSHYCLVLLYMNNMSRKQIEF